MSEAIKLLLWLIKKAQSLGIKVSVLHRLENALLVDYLTRESISTKNTVTTSATNTTGILKSTDIFLAIQKLNKSLDNRNLNGLAKRLGITKEGVQRLIWLLGDVQNTRNGLGLSLSEMISLVRNAVLRERILKQTTTLLNTRLSLMKKELQLTRKQLIVPAYGIQKTGERYVGNAIV